MWKQKFAIIDNTYLIETGDTTLPDLDQIVEMAKDAQKNNSEASALPNSLEEIIQVDDDNDVQQATAG